MGENESGSFTLAVQGSISFLGNVSGKVLGFLFVAIATRLVSPDEYGAFTLGLSIVMFVHGFASLNIYRSVDYFIPRFLKESKHGEAKMTLVKVFAIGCLTSALAAFIVFLSRDYVATIFDEPRLVSLLPFFVFLIPLQTALRTLIASFNSIKNMKYRVAIRDLLNPLTRTLGAIVFVTAGAGVIGLVGGYLLGLVVAVSFGVAFLLYETDWIRGPSLRPVSNKSLLSYSLPLMFAGVIYSLVGQIDYFMIGYFQSSAEVGQYRVAYLLSANLLIVLSALTPIFKPLVAENSADAAFLASQFRLVTRWVAMLTIPIAIPLVLAPDIYISILFTEQYTNASLALIALTIGYLFNALFGPEGMVLEGLGYTRLTFINTVILLAINSVLDIVLIPQFGILGAGIATGSALAITGLAGVLEIQLLCGFHPFSWRLARIWSSAFIPALAGLITVALTNNRWITALCLPVVVIVFQILGLRSVGGFTQADKDILSSLDSRLGCPISKLILKS